MRRAQDEGGGGVRRFQRQVRVPQDQGHAQDRRLGEGAPQDHGRGRSDGACSRTTRVRLIRGRDHAGSWQPRRPRLHGRDAEREMARGRHPGSGPGTGRACLSPPVDCHDGRIVAYTAGSGPDAGLADRMLVKAAETPPEGAHPLVYSDRGCHCRRPGWLDLMDRYGLTRSTGAKGRSPDDAAAEGSLGRMRTESVYPGRWGSVPATGCSSRSTTASAGTTTGASDGRPVGWVWCNTVRAREWLRDHLQENVRSPLPSEDRAFISGNLSFLLFSRSSSPVVSSMNRYCMKAILVDVSSKRISIDSTRLSSSLSSQSAK